MRSASSEVKKLFLDTNILLDIVSDSRPMSAHSSALVAEALESEIDCLCGAGSLKDVYYIYERMTRSEEAARGKIRVLKSIFTVIDLNGAVLDTALASDEPDFEDGIVRASAELSGVDLIITNDIDAFKTSFVRKATTMEATVLLNR